MLPPQVRDGLLFSHVVELARLDDPTTRARLAMDTTQQHWTVDQLKAAIAQLTIGNYYDTDSALPGTQPPAPRDEPEKASTGHLRGEQREKYKQAPAALKAEVAAMEVELD